MVSRSKDGQIIVPALKANGHVPVRGSAGSSEKGGASALKALIEYNDVGKPVILTVDGPRGPRGSVHKGIGVLAKKSGAGVLVVLTVPRRRIVMKSAWDRFQFPIPFSTINAYFSEPMFPSRGERMEDFAKRIESELARLEALYDPQESQQYRNSVEEQNSVRKAA